MLLPGHLALQVEQSWVFTLESLITYPKRVPKRVGHVQSRVEYLQSADHSPPSQSGVLLHSIGVHSNCIFHFKILHEFVPFRPVDRIIGVINVQRRQYVCG